ncbi:hypothetical protein MMC28_010594 [Mycoblastus sanguinarius]|nr:hypothetical protein [Mycoblastus sanguinarius]
MERQTILVEILEMLAALMYKVMLLPPHAFNAAQDLKNNGSGNEAADYTKEASGKSKFITRTDDAMIMAAADAHLSLAPKAGASPHAYVIGGGIIEK